MNKILSFLIALSAPAVATGCALGADTVSAEPTQAFPAAKAFDDPVATAFAPCPPGPRDGGWTVLRFAEAGLEGAPRLAMSPNGHAAIVWYHEDLGRRLWASRYAPGEVWSPPADVSQAGHFPSDARVAVNDAGHAVLVWHDEVTPTSDRLATRAYVSGPTWTQPVFFEPLAGEPAVALDPNGMVTVASRGLVYRPSTDVGGQQYELSSGPRASTPLSAGCASCATPEVALLEGAPIVIWNHAGGSKDGIWARRVDSAGEAQLVSTGLGPTSNPRIASNGRDRAIAVWEQVSGQSTQIWAAPFDVQPGWGAPVLLSGTATSATSPRIAVDARGHAMVVWIQPDASGSQIRASAFDASTGWSVSQVVAAAAGMARPELAIEPSGHAMAVWEQSDGALSRIWVARHSVGSGWQPPAPISDDVSPATMPALAMDASGRAFAAWRQNQALFVARFE